MSLSNWWDSSRLLGQVPCRIQSRHCIYHIYIYIYHFKFAICDGTTHLATPVCGALTPHRLYLVPWLRCHHCQITKWVLQIFPSELEGGLTGLCFQQQLAGFWWWLNEKVLPQCLPWPWWLSCSVGLDMEAASALYRVLLWCLVLHQLWLSGPVGLAAEAVYCPSSDSCSDWCPAPFLGFDAEVSQIWPTESWAFCDPYTPHCHPWMVQAPLMYLLLHHHL